MGEHVCFLISVLQESDNTLMKCALKIKKGTLKQEYLEFYMEEASRKELHNLLPLHVRNCGPIVDIEEIFEIHETKNRG